MLMKINIQSAKMTIAEIKVFERKGDISQNNYTEQKETIHVSSGKHVLEMYTPVNPTFIWKKTGVCGGIPIFLIFAPKHRLWVLVRTASARRF